MHVTVYESLLDIPSSFAWRLRYPNQKNFFLTLDWFTCIYETVLASSVSPRIYTIVDGGGTPIAAMICGANRRTRTLVSMTNFYTLEFAPVMLSDRVSSRIVLQEIFDHVRREKPRWNVLDFRLLPADFIRSSAFVDCLENRGFFAHTFLQYENWFLRAEGRDFDTYFAGRSSKLRNTLAKKAKRLRKSHEHEFRLYTDASIDLEAATKAYTEIYRRRWKHSEPVPEFIPKLIGCCAALGILRLGILYVDSKACAAQFWITTASKAMIYKLAHDGQYGDLSPGSLLSKHMFRHAFEVDRVTEIDYGVGSETYKREWVDSMRLVEGVRAFNTKTVRGAALAASEKVKMVLKRGSLDAGAVRNAFSGSGRSIVHV